MENELTLMLLQNFGTPYQIISSLVIQYVLLKLLSRPILSKRFMIVSFNILIL